MFHAENFLEAANCLRGASLEPIFGRMDRIEYSRATTKDREQMLASEKLARQLESLDAEIEEILNALFKGEDGLRNAGTRLRWFRALRVRLLVRGLRNRLRDLRGRRVLVDTCYSETRAYEGWLDLTKKNNQRETATL